jgi:hypothetical protein
MHNQKNNNFSRRPEGGVQPRLQRTIGFQETIARFCSTPDIGPGEPLMFGKPAATSLRAAGSKTNSDFARLIRESHMASNFMAPNFKLKKTFCFFRTRIPETPPSPPIRYHKSDWLSSQTCEPSHYSPARAS